jgi:hypothetical protein
MSRFVYKFAAGRKGGATSGVWRLWTARNQPDLYLAINGLGGLKATVHCPRANRPTWARNWGFTSETTYEVAKLVNAAMPGRHKLSWTGARLAPEVTLEWRIFIFGEGLRKSPIIVSGDVAPLSQPANISFAGVHWSESQHGGLSAGLRCKNTSTSGGSVVRRPARLVDLLLRTDKNGWHT